MRARKKKKKASPRKVARRKARASARNAAKKRASRKSGARKPARAKTHRLRGKSEEVNRVEFEPSGLGLRSGGQSGDLQGLSNFAGADSESVGELLEEGNAFEAEIVRAVQDAPDPDRQEIRTREVLEDDVPEEYLEQE